MKVAFNAPDTADNAMYDAKINGKNTYVIREL